MTLDAPASLLRRFAQELNGGLYHTPKDLAMAIAGEAGGWTRSPVAHR